MKEGLVAMGGMEKITVETEDDLPPHQRHLEDQARGLQIEDVYALQNSASLVHTFAPRISRAGRGYSVRLTKGSRSCRPWSFAGTWPDALKIRQHTIGHGRMFNTLMTPKREMSSSSAPASATTYLVLLRRPANISFPLGKLSRFKVNPSLSLGCSSTESDRFRRERLARGSRPSRSSKRHYPAFPASRTGSLCVPHQNMTSFIPLIRC